MAGSKGKEAFRRPLRQLKLLPRKSSASPGLFSSSSAHHTRSRHRPLTQCQSLADAELGEDVGVVSPSPGAGSPSDHVYPAQIHDWTSVNLSWTSLDIRYSLLDFIGHSVIWAQQRLMVTWCLIGR
ncbi:uncharacterized protein LACBIDRAFT_325856 [Laccaria bicolor S238N-H82]|uniref:Predicted protein n=1 Tax=Laccaria bicolor (strain S238N-H82 / ATCC MYA-4686) TaxID=486041 RepID=B0D6G5_LACBS|nr:uncharacterized protein LACBIDRAFT_325856 [Laccaria bicolor S238N-H82]EDR09948.1 predicted protein [Laccaria bicolor S238N-H82]|eukprot:XP_001879333.1 predicted protein [Laccaria bicolor S238N-H82]